MKEYLANEIRNIAIIGHSGEGKTSLTEALLFNAKAIDRIGKTFTIIHIDIPPGNYLASNSFSF